jgi:hypothetical protein
MAELRGRKPAMDAWNLKECSVFLQYKKEDTDAKMPTKVADRRKRCQEITHRPSPCCSPHASDDEDEENSAAGNIVFDTSSVTPDNIIDEAATVSNPSKRERIKLVSSVVICTCAKRKR